jgi:hypothetical protein
MRQPSYGAACAGVKRARTFDDVIATWGHALAPVGALAAGGIGAALGASLDGRLLRRVSRAAWVRAGLAAAGAGGAAGLGMAVLRHLVPGLAGAWRPPAPVVLTLAAVAAAAAPGSGWPARLVPLVRGGAALLAAAALLPPWGAARVPLRPGAVALGLAVGAGMAGVALAARALGRERAAPGAPAGLVAALALVAGAGYATGVSPFVLCALVAAVAANAPRRRHAARRLRRLLARGERLAVAGLGLAAAALLARPTAWLVAAGVLVAGLGAAGGGAAVRWGGLLLRMPAPPAARAAPGSLGLALAVNFALMNEAGAAALTAAVSAVLAARLAAPALGRLVAAPRAPWRRAAATAP